MGLKCCTNPKSFPLRDGHSDGDADSDPISIQFRLRSSVFVFRDRASSPRTAHCQLCLSVPDRDMPDRDRVGVGYRRVFCISTTFGRYIGTHLSAPSLTSALRVHALARSRHVRHAPWISIRVSGRDAKRGCGQGGVASATPRRARGRASLVDTIWHFRPWVHMLSTQCVPSRVSHNLRTAHTAKVPRSRSDPSKSAYRSAEAVPASVPGPGVSGPRWRHAHAGWRPGFR